MPHSVSARKRVRQNEALRLRNKAVKSAMRSQVKKVKNLIAAGDAEGARREFVRATKQLDKAAKRNVIHPNKAAREKSRLARHISEIA